MKKVFIVLVMLMFFVPSVSSAAALSQVQINAIISLLFAFNVDQQTILAVQKALTPQSTSPTTNVQPQNSQTPAAPQLAPIPYSVVTPISTPVSQARIEIVNTINGKGLGRQYKAYDWNPFNATAQSIADNERPAGFVFPNESNYIELGAVLYNDDGSFNSAARMTVTATDGEQNKIMVGTGNVQWYYVNYDKRQRHYYPYHYEFKTAGKHTITFEANGVTASVELEVQ